MRSCPEVDAERAAVGGGGCEGDFLAMPMHDWTNFFLITGAAGAQLIGLLFVVVTLGTGLPTAQSLAGIRAFLTPTLFCFSSVFFQAIAVLVPQSWPTRLGVVVLGLAGVAYGVRAIHLRRRLDFVSLRGASWLPYNAVPLIANVVLTAGGVALITGQDFALGAIATATTLLLVAGIYGAWDLTLWMIENRGKA